MKKVTLVSAKGIKGGKVQLTFSQLVETGKTPTGLLGILNASDDRFNQSKPRYAWLSAQPADVQLQFGLDVSGLAEGQELEIDMVDPKIAGDDRSLNLQITETTKGTDYDVANFETRAKRAGKDGDFITTADGQYIYVNTSVVVGEAKHTFITETARQAVTGSSAIADALGI